MIYECDHCEEHLSPNAFICPRCGQKFDAPVPRDAAPPPGGAWHVPSTIRGKSAAARATIVLPRGSGEIPPQSALKTLLDAVLPISGTARTERGKAMPRQATKIKH